MVLLISPTLIIGTITGFVFFNEGDLFNGVAGQVLHGLMSITFHAGRSCLLALRLESRRD